METINPASFVSLWEAFILVGSTAYLVYALVNKSAFAYFRMFMDALFKTRKHVFRCSFCLGLWVGLLNGTALILSKSILSLYKGMVAMDGALTLALLVFIINVIINKLNANNRTLIQIKQSNRRPSPR